MERGVGLKLSGDAEATGSFKKMLAEGLLGSAGLRDVYGDLFDTKKMGEGMRPADLARGANHLNLGRHQPGVIGNSVRTGAFDVSDLETLTSFPTGDKRNEFSREDMLAHVFSEQLLVREKRMRNEPISAVQFRKAHQKAINEGTNTTRAERGAHPLDAQVGIEDDQGRTTRSVFSFEGKVLDQMKIVDGDYQRSSGGCSAAAHPSPSPTPLHTHAHHALIGPRWPGR